MEKKINLNDKIFVAGANGMAGNAICKSLLEMGYGKKEYGGALLTPDRKKLDLLNTNAVEKWFFKHKPSVVILAAAKVGGILSNKTYPTEFLLDNLKIQSNVIEASWKNGTRRLLFLGSSCIYPKLAAQPIKEEYLLERSLEKTNEYYAIAKITGVKLCEALRKQYGFDAISIMPTNLYGPGDNYHSTNSHVMASLIAKFCKAEKDSKKYVECWGSGKPLREFLHVNDLGSAVVFCLENWDPSSEKSPKDSEGNYLNHLNIGTGKDISIKQLAEKIRMLTGFKGEVIWDTSKPDGTPQKLLDIEKISKLGWTAQIKLNDGIKETIFNYRNCILNKN